VKPRWIALENMGKRDVADIIGNAAHAGATDNSARARAHQHANTTGPLIPLRTVPVGDWLALCRNAAEPNGYFLPDWESAVDASARGRSNVAAVCARNDARQLIALLPVVSAWRAYKLPLPVLISADPYGDLSTPLIDGRAPLDAARALLAQARNSGAHAIVLRHVTLEGAAMTALITALQEMDLAPHVLRAEQRACLDAKRDADELLREALGAKKLKELRRQHNRLAEIGPVSFTVAKTPAEVAAELDVFLELEASGWKADRGTALKQHPGDLTFIRRATAAMAARGACEVVTLRAGDTPVASGVVLRHLDTAFWFKLGVDVHHAKHSVGVQLALELTRHLCADARIARADSTALPGHPMIDPIWRGRLPIGDVVIPLKRNSIAFKLVVAALEARKRARVHLRQLVRTLRTFKEKRS
jgi:CelD/BcsL family acetyltransferase involved in cellulose biosynthesis